MGAPRAPRDAVFSGRGNAATPAMGTCLFQHICELGWSSPVPLARKVPLGSPKGAPVTAPPDPALAETLQPLGSPPGAQAVRGCRGCRGWGPCFLEAMPAPPWPHSGLAARVAPAPTATPESPGLRSPIWHSQGSGQGRAFGGQGEVSAWGCWAPTPRRAPRTVDCLPGVS